MSFSDNASSSPLPSSLRRRGCLVLNETAVLPAKEALVLSLPTHSSLPSDKTNQHDIKASNRRQFDRNNQNYRRPRNLLFFFRRRHRRYPPWLLRGYTCTTYTNILFVIMVLILIVDILVLSVRQRVLVPDVPSALKDNVSDVYNGHFHAIVFTNVMTKGVFHSETPRFLRPLQVSTISIPALTVENDGLEEWVSNESDEESSEDEDNASSKEENVLPEEEDGLPDEVKEFSASKEMDNTLDDGGDTEVDDDSNDENSPNYGGLDVQFLDLGAVRQIDPTDNEKYQEEMTELLQYNDYYPRGMDYYFLPDEDLDPASDCRRNNWQSKAYLNCNSFHEMTLHRPPDHGRFQTYNVSWRGEGAYRNGWLLEPSVMTSSPKTIGLAEDASFVWKTLRMEQDVNIEVVYMMRMEAIIMERLSSSPRVINIYGYCGTSIFAEHMLHEIAPEVVPGWPIPSTLQSNFDYDSDNVGYISQQELDTFQLYDVFPMNNLSTKEKLAYSIIMAESIADIHGFQGGVIIHGDIHPVQWLRSASGAIKINDFNNGEILAFNRTSNTQYCEAWRCYEGTFRPPEEILCLYGNEQVDTFAMGNIIYTLLTGLWPFYEHGPDMANLVMDKIKRKERPYVDDRYRNRSLIEGNLVDIMELCWEWDYRKRVSIFDVLKQLYNLQRLVEEGELKTKWPTADSRRMSGGSSKGESHQKKEEN